MGIGKCFKMAISTVWASKVRSFLTMLGIIIGIAAVIILVSLMGGLTSQITEMFDDLGTNTIQVTINPRASTRRVDPEEMYEFLDEHLDLFEDATPVISVMGLIKKDGENEGGSAKGVSEGYADMQSLVVEQGRFLQYSDIANMSNVCVIGTYQEDNFFGKGNALGNTIKLNGVSFKVVGVLEESDDSTSGSSDDCMYIPYTTAMKKMSKSSVVASYMLTAADENRIEETTSVLEKFLEEKIGDSDYYTVTSMKEMIDQMTSMLDSMQTVLVCIAGISLLVGGIGIMNIMLVSVTERTREIGIRKALGAKQKNILMQFVIEAAVVSCIGGIIGILLGSVTAVFAGNLLLDRLVTPSVASIVVAFSVSCAIGVGFGYLPARKAAQLNPIDALRYD